MRSEELSVEVDARPFDWGLRLKFVHALVGEGCLESAVAAINDGVSNGIPENGAAWLHAAECYAAVGAMEHAQRLAETALHIDPDSEAARAFYNQLLDQVDSSEERAAVKAGEADTGGRVVEEGAQHRNLVLSLTKLEDLHENEEAAKRRREAVIHRDRFKSIAATVVVHGLLILFVWSIVAKTPPNGRPGIVAEAVQHYETKPPLSTPGLDKPTSSTPVPAATFLTHAVAANGVTDLALDTVVIDAFVDVSADIAGQSFQPSMLSLSDLPPTDGQRRLFNQPIEGQALGVILDVSGSMAEFLPQVVREVDKNFENAPIVYVKNMLLRPEFRDEAEVRLIIPEEVVPRVPYEGRMVNTPYHFLWHDLPRKAPQRYVDRLIESFRTRPASFLAVTDHDRSGVREAIDFLIDQKVDSIYVFSDYEDFVDEEVALEFGQKLGRRRIKTYVQPAERGTEFLESITKRLVNRTGGRQLPSLTAIRRGSAEDVQSSEPTAGPAIESVTTHARPRAEMLDRQPYSWKPRATWQRIKELDHPRYTAVFYGPEAQVAIFLKNDAGGYIQQPIRFSWHSWKEIPDYPDPAFRRRHRQFLRADEPIVRNDSFQWNMVLEDELKMEVRLYLQPDGMTATYTADLPADGTHDHADIRFLIPELALERSDSFFGYDLPAIGARLDQVRVGAMENFWTMELPRELRDTYGRQWAQRGFEPGIVKRHFNELIREYPAGVREIVTQGPSFAERKISLRTTSKEVLLRGWGRRRDSEPWEGFSGVFLRPADRRTSFRKSEALEIEIR